MMASTPLFFQSEVIQQKDAHLVIGMETRNDENVLTSRWTASAVEVEEDDDSHLELVLHTFLHSQGRSTMLLLLELGQYLECTKALLEIPELKSEHKIEKCAGVFGVYGFIRDDNHHKSQNSLFMTYEYPTSTTSSQAITSTQVASEIS
ncbi:uncharacterized protein MONOS_3452 [Monocercomonoides exilis]|uniref:uncharacterized protein n=1 Tax=Monocercomonoides exilis TaxID=2049356 RepID=UPI00355A0725|nr:hypothetical protein MONOS_3452 [Monocercomonoides exilis]|eukprot:MONOS_3452.1-p1 / transcript=MONOS_3452.1 / gene=MONOS_3452 / organism=Monocercomonoides_exilis_PA203 / gene_product=unspecified product / transcript_product=unspecified product / location=Mono_scaffold00081:118290-118736(-) / protein_length=149 / sequence_SO=supercontig / SO=protein_coding / is_pseudo=false